MHRIIILGLAGLAVSGCALPPVVIAVSYATDGVLLATTGKTKTDHILSAGAKQDCATFRVVQGKDICHDWADGKNPYAEVKDDNSNLSAGNEIGIPIYQATLDNDPFKRPAAKNDADKFAKNEPSKPATAEIGNDNNTAAPITAAPAGPPTPTAPDAVVTVDTGGVDAIVPVSSSDVSEVIDRAPTAPAPAQKAPAKVSANGKKAGAKIAKAPSKPAPVLAAALLAGNDYVVLLGSFRSPTNAKRAVRQHRALNPMIAQAEVQGIHYWRVSAGPYSAEKANQLAQRLREDGVRDAMVVREGGKSNQALLAGHNGTQQAALR